jgi:hypothetical protein
VRIRQFAPALVQELGLDLTEHQINNAVLGALVRQQQHTSNHLPSSPAERLALIFRHNCRCGAAAWGGHLRVCMLCTTACCRPPHWHWHWHWHTR